ncbi:hypothetical protein BY996DRAFT_4576809, partial [Phakopsora pachyrhizi]
RSNLTLDDILPPPTINNRSNQHHSSDVRHQTSNTNHQSDLPDNNSYSNIRLSSSSSLARSSGIEMITDPLRRRSGDNTHYSLIIRSTSNNTRLTLTHTPISYLPGSHDGDPAYRRSFPRAGQIVSVVTSGSVGFKRGRRQDYEAATQASLKMLNNIRDILKIPKSSSSSSSSQDHRVTVREGIPREFEIVFDGFGVGRDAFFSTIMNSQSTDLREMVRSIRDVTTVRIGGTRPKKIRRV